MKYLFPEARIFVFTKPPIPGKCKTRLIPYLGKEGAAKLQLNLINKIIKDLTSFQLCPFEIWQSEPTDFFTDLLKNSVYENIRVQTQSGDNLGSRMKNAIDAGLKETNKIILIGSDCVEYTKSYLIKALSILDRNEIVIGPANDGGYVLIGTTVNPPFLFEDINWGSQYVLPQTIAKLQHSELTYSQLQPLNDIDTPTDLQIALNYVGESLQII